MGTVDGLRRTEVNGKQGGILYPVMVIAAIAVILFSIVGIATMTGVMPGALSKGDLESANTPGKEAPPATVPAGKSSSVRPPASGASRSATGAAAGCADCGVVESIRVVESKGQGSGLGAVAGGVVGGLLGNQVGRGGGRTAATVVGAGAGAYAGHEIERNMNSSPSYQIRVRMGDGTLRTFYERSQPALSVGQKVRATEKGLVTAGQ